MNSSVIECIDDRSCPYSSICYVNTTWAPDQGVCGCDSTYGEVGNDCSGISAFKAMKISQYHKRPRTSLLRVAVILKESGRENDTVRREKNRSRIGLFEIVSTLPFRGG